MNTTDLPLSTVLRLALSNNDTLFVSFTKKDGTPACREITGDPVFVRHLGGSLPQGLCRTAPGYICAFDIIKKGWILIGEDKITGVSAYSRKTEKMLNMN